MKEANKEFDLIRAFWKRIAGCMNLESVLRG